MAQENAPRGDLPPCGLYRTTTPHPARPEQVAAGRLVHFHNHSNTGKPMVLMPRTNEHNVWSFHDKGYTIDDLAWVDSLEALPEEGLYTAAIPLQLGERAVAAGQLLQLGYNGNGDPILFFPTKATSANALMFPDKGVRVEREVLTHLRRVLLAGLQPAGQH